MKKNATKTIALALVLSAGLFVACDKSDDTKGKNIDALEPVAFANQPDKEISSVKTGQQELNPSTGNNDYVYLTTVEKQTSLSPLSIINGINSDVIYPGSILRGSSFVNAVYDPLVLKNPFKPVVLSMTLRGNNNLQISDNVRPVLSEIRNSINGLVSQNKANIDYEAIPSYFEYQSDMITTQSSFKKSLDSHLGVDVLFGLVSVNFGYSQSSSSSTDKKYVMVRVRQQLYSLSIDPKHYTDWIDGDINGNDFGTHEPVYVSNIDYGRVAYILIETTKTEDYNQKMVNGSVNVALSKIVDVGLDTTYSEEFKGLFAQGKVKVLISGGPASLAGQVNSYDSFVKFLETPTVSSLVSSSAPISYKIRRLKDNTEVEVKDTYTEIKKELKPN